MLCLDVRRALDELARQGVRFDLVLCDAPYEQGLSAEILVRLCAPGLLAQGGWVMLELSRREVAPDEPGLERVSVAILGDHQIVIYRRETIADE